MITLTLALPVGDHLSRQRRELCRHRAVSRTHVDQPLERTCLGLGLGLGQGLGLGSGLGLGLKLGLGLGLGSVVRGKGQGQGQG